MYLPIKRALDILLVLLTAPLWLPLMAFLAILVKTTSPGPVLFKQKRYGQNRQFFMIYKFRSMYTNAPKDVPTHLLQNPAALITPVGRFLRKSSLDELPQLINILKGDLSLVGPRPALWNQDDLIAEREKYGANAIPVGLTGLAQVSGRDELPLEEKAAYDGEYVRRMGLFFDAYILMRTVFGVFLSRGVSEGGPKK
jgi:O-antigen biosynthesis protein WbqP